MNTLVIFNVFTRLCNHHHYIILEHCYLLKKDITSHSPLSGPWQLIIYFSLGICLFWISHIEWNHTIHVSFSIVFSRLINVLACQYFIIFLWLNNIWIYHSYLAIYQLMIFGLFSLFSY